MDLAFSIDVPCRRDCRIFGVNHSRGAVGRDLRGRNAGGSFSDRAARIGR